MDSLLRFDAARQIADRALDDARRLGVRISVAVSGATSVQDHEIAERAVAAEAR